MALTPRYTLSRTGTLSRVRGSAWAERCFGRQIVLSRGLCAFDSFDLSSDLTTTQARKAAVLQVKARSPFPEPGLYLRLYGTRVQAWTWDEAALKALGVHGGQIIPETEIHPAVNGFALRSCIDGCEAQLYADDGTLIQSQWWPYAPTLGDLRVFASSSPVPIDAGSLQSSPEDISEALRTSDAKGSQAGLAYLLTRADKRALAAIALGVVALPLAYNGLRLWHLDRVETDLRLELEASREMLGPKRAETLALSRKVGTLRDYTRLQTVTQPLLSLADVLSTFDGSQIRMTGLTIADDSISLTLNIDPDVEFDEVELVREMEAKPYITSVSMSPGRRSTDWNVEAQMVVPQNEGDAS